MKKCQNLIITNAKACDSPVMLRFFQHLTFSITHRSWHEVMNECESTGLIFISPRFRMTTMDYRRQVGVSGE